MNKKLIYSLKILKALTYSFLYYKKHKQLALPGMKRPITFFRDSYGVPHIKAESEDDLFLGYTQAQDRLFQMDMTRRAAKERLSEIFGEYTPSKHCQKVFL